MVPHAFSIASLTYICAINVPNFTDVSDSEDM